MNESGVYPVDRKVLVKPETFEEKTKGGIVLPDSARERDNMAHIKATIVACGVNAFEYIEKAKQRPQVGQKAAIAKFSGYLITGADGKSYRLINDEDVVAMLDGDWDIRYKKEGS